MTLHGTHTNTWSTPGQVHGKKLLPRTPWRKEEADNKTGATTAFKVHLNNTEASLANTDRSGLFPLGETTVKSSDSSMRSNSEPISSQNTLSNSDSSALKHPMPLSMHHLAQIHKTSS